MIEMRRNCGEEVELRQCQWLRLYWVKIGMIPGRYMSAFLGIDQMVLLRSAHRRRVLRLLHCGYIYISISTLTAKDAERGRTS